MTAVVYGKLNAAPSVLAGRIVLKCPASVGHLPFRARRAKLPVHYPSSSTERSKNALSDVGLTRSSSLTMGISGCQPGHMTPSLKMISRRTSHAEPVPLHRKSCSQRRGDLGGRLLSVARATRPNGLALPPNGGSKRKGGFTTSNQYEGDPRSQCAGKLGFRTKAAAKRKIRRLKTFRGARSDLRVYRCPHCRAFHIGTKP